MGLSIQLPHGINEIKGGSKEDRHFFVFLLSPVVSQKVSKPCFQLWHTNSWTHLWLCSLCPAHSPILLSLWTAETCMLIVIVCFPIHGQGHLNQVGWCCRCFFFFLTCWSTISLTYSVSPGHLSAWINSIHPGPCDLENNQKLLLWEWLCSLQLHFHLCMICSNFSEGFHQNKDVCLWWMDLCHW